MKILGFFSKKKYFPLDISMALSRGSLFLYKRGWVLTSNANATKNIIRNACYVVNDKKCNIIDSFCLKSYPQD